MKISEKYYLLVEMQIRFFKVWGKILEILSEIACDAHVTGCVFQCSKHKFSERKEKGCNQNLWSVPC